LQRQLQRLRRRQPESDVVELTGVIRVCLDCADVCEATATISTRQTCPAIRLVRATIEAYAAACACFRSSPPAVGSPRAPSSTSPSTPVVPPRTAGGSCSRQTAFALGVLALAGPRHSDRLRAFMLTVVVADDILAIAVHRDRLHGRRERAGPAGGARSLRRRRRRSQAARPPRPALPRARRRDLVAVLESGIDPVIVGLGMGPLACAYPPDLGTTPPSPMQPSAASRRSRLTSAARSASQASRRVRRHRQSGRRRARSCHPRIRR
jgi:hypothetical protein